MTNKKIRFHFLLLIIFPLLISWESYAQETKNSNQVKAFSLKEVQEYAVRNSYSVRNADIDTVIAKQKIWETTALGLPQINAKVSYSYTPNIPSLNFPTTGIGDKDLSYVKEKGFQQTKVGQELYMYMLEGDPIQMGVKSNTTMTFTATQLIFSGEYIVGLQASRTFAALSSQSAQKSKRDIIENVTKTYYLCLIMEENNNILDSSYVLIKKTSEEIQKMYEQGLVEETDADQMKITEATLKNSLQLVKRQTEISQRLLKFQIGIDLDQPISLKDKIKDIIQLINLEYFTNQSYDISKNIDYKLIKTAEDLNYLSYKRSLTKFLPSVAGFYQYTYLFKQPEFNFQPKHVLGVSVEIPILSSGMRALQASQAKLTYIKSQIATEQVTQSLKLEFEQTRSEYASAVEKYQTFKDNLALAKKIYDKTIIKYREGISSSLELTQMQNQYLSTESNYFSALLEVINAKTKLERILTKY
jgi:outer membrane protein TolC